MLSNNRRRYNLRNVTIKDLRDFILDNGITDNDTITLNGYDFDELALDYRAVFKEGLTTPYLLLGVLIKEDETSRTPQGSLIVIENDTESIRVADVEDNEPHYITVAYRCGWCGNVVSEKGNMLSFSERNQIIDHFEHNKKNVKEVRVDGYCCRDRRAG